MTCPVRRAPLRSSPARALATAVLLLALGGCGERAELASSGGADLDAPDHTIEVVPETLYEVGGFDAPEWAMFGNIIAVAFDARGHLYLLDSQANTVTEVDTEGNFVRTIGRRGEGPGELSSVQTVTVTSRGEVAVFDLGHSAWVVYDSTGDFLRNVRVDITELGFPRGDMAAHPEGGVVSSMTGRIMVARPGSGAPATAATRPVAWYSLDDADASHVLYEAWTLPPVESEGRTRLELEGGGQIQLALPVLRAFEPALKTAPLPDGRVAVVDSVGYRIKLVASDGAVTGALERPVEAVAVTPRIQDAERRRRAEQMASQQGGAPTMSIMVRGGTTAGGANAGTTVGGAVDAGAVRRMMEGQLESMVFAEAIPVIEDIAVDGQGRLWVQRSSGQPGVVGPTDLITVDGRYLGTIPADGIRIPRAFGPGGLLVRQVTDEYDVQTLIVERVPAEVGG